MSAANVEREAEGDRKMLLAHKAKDGARTMIRGGDASTMGNRYCERLGLASVPRVEDVLGRDKVNLFHLMVVALLERGGPMAVEEIAERLTDAGATAESGDTALSIKKAWHGREPVYRDPDGRLGLNLSAPAAALAPARGPASTPLAGARAAAGA